MVDALVCAGAVVLEVVGAGVVVGTAAVSVVMFQLPQFLLI